jgi:hypothetical protein
MDFGVVPKAAPRKEAMILLSVAVWSSLLCACAFHYFDTFALPE